MSNPTEFVIGQQYAVFATNPRLESIYEGNCLCHPDTIITCFQVAHSIDPDGGSEIYVIGDHTDRHGLIVVSAVHKYYPGMTGDFYLWEMCI